MPQGAANTAQILGDRVAERLSDQELDCRFLAGLCLLVPRSVFIDIGLLDESLVLGADDLEFCWRARRLGYGLKIALGAFVHHGDHASFRTRPESETSPLVAASDARLAAKLRSYYGARVPTSQQLWGTAIFADAMAREGAA